jgi:outer membrane murein-binding lipoprotein Lpp
MDKIQQLATDLHYLSSKIATMSLELSSNEADTDAIADEFDDLHAYIMRYMDDSNQVEGGLVFRMADGRGISVGLVLINVDEDVI